jgi:hypothetical protein
MGAAFLAYPDIVRELTTSYTGIDWLTGTMVFHVPDEPTAALPTRGTLATADEVVDVCFKRTRYCLLAYPDIVRELTTSYARM